MDEWKRIRGCSPERILCIFLTVGTIRSHRLGKTWKVSHSSLKEFLKGCDNSRQE